MNLLHHVVPPPGPIRRLVSSSFARSVGHGILLSVSVLFFLRSVGIPAAQVGLGLTIAALVGMLASIPAGHAADVLGARNTATFFVVLQGVLIFTYALVGSFPAFVVASCLVVLAEASSSASRGALVAKVVPAGERVAARAFMRSTNNLGVSIGAVAGGVALHFDTRPVYLGMLFLSGVLYVGAGLVYLTFPQVPGVAKPAEGPRLPVLRDKPFVVISLLNTVLMMNAGILTVGVPIWITERTAAPTWTFSAMLVLNTAMVILFQVRVSKGADDVVGGARALQRCGVALAACCAVFALAAGRAPWLAVGILIVGAVVHVLGELLCAAGGWALAYELAPEHAIGQYQGLFATTEQLSAAITPALVTALVIGFGWPGWLVLGGLMLAAGAVVPAVARWGLRTRERYGVVAVEPVAPSPAAT
ncbi:MFS transporter [Micromonospora arborensis]|uniref:MFS transporter n=1 Tax=Micromonospora arborensis TaxID=2116518 RepID=A0A318NIA2_9ACTN|nr:MFS transporter [Micromonospora arborensis]PYC66846.1 MFS transporter [Micromonospora arborensis]